MEYDVKRVHALLSWLPGYMWSHGTLISTGSAIRPTMHMDHKTGDIKVYVRPLFRGGATVGLFLPLKGVQAAVARGQF